MVQSNYKIIISDKARQMLAEQLRFLAQADKKAAIKKKKDIIKAIRSLDHNPKRYPFLEEPYLPHNKYHKMFVNNWYLVLYQIQDDTVYVDYIVDCRQEYSWLVH